MQNRFFSLIYEIILQGDWWSTVWTDKCFIFHLLSFSSKLCYPVQGKHMHIQINAHHAEEENTHKPLRKQIWLHKPWIYGNVRIWILLVRASLLWLHITMLPLSPWKILNTTKPNNVHRLMAEISSADPVYVIRTSQLFNLCATGFFSHRINWVVCNYFCIHQMCQNASIGSIPKLFHAVIVDTHLHHLDDTPPI